MLCPGYMYIRLHIRKYNKIRERKNKQKKAQKIDKNNIKRKMNKTKQKKKNKL